MFKVIQNQQRPGENYTPASTAWSVYDWLQNYSTD